MKKKLENFWYYHKWHVLIAVIAAVILVFSFQPKDASDGAYNIAIVSPEYYTDEQLAALKNALSAEYATVNINVYHIELCAENQDEIEIGRLDTDLISKKSVAFLLADVDAFKEVTNGIGLTEAVRVKDIDSIKGLGFDDLYFVRRLDW